MALLYLTALSGPSKNLLSTSLQHIQPQTTLNDNTGRSVTVDACDLFQCGQCMKLFTSLNVFISHKSAHCQGEVNQVTYLLEGTSNDDSSTQLLCDALEQTTGSVSLTEEPVSSSLQLASNILCDNQIYKDYENQDGELIQSSPKVTAFENIRVVSNGGLPVKLPVPGSISLTDITDNTGEVFLVNDNNNNESETICEPVSLESNISGYKNLKCNYCSKEFTKLSNLKQHILSHTGERPYNCVLCGKKFAQVSNAKKHISSHKVWPEPWKIDSKTVNSKSNILEPKLFSCLYCPLEFNSISKLKNHRQKTHSSQKVFKCLLSECKETFSDVDSVTYHLYNHPPATFRCSLCNIKFSSFAKLSQHRVTHSFEAVSRPDKCNDCKVENLECPVCSKVLASTETLRRHLTTHISRSYPCPAPNCSKYFASIRTAKSHYIHTHSPSSHIVRYQCQVCFAMFKRYDNLIRHRKNHKRALLKCPFNKAGCMKTFCRTDVLKRHAFTHIRKKNMCNSCKQPLVMLGSWHEFNIMCNCPSESKPELLSTYTSFSKPCYDMLEIKVEDGMSLSKGEPDQDIMDFQTDTDLDLSQFNINYNLNMDDPIDDADLDFNLDDDQFISDHLKLDGSNGVTSGAYEYD